MTRFHQRRKKLASAVRRMGADAILITNFTNVTYLTGFTGDDSYLLVGAGVEVLLSDPRYTQQLGEECPGPGSGDSTPERHDHVVGGVRGEEGSRHAPGGRSRPP